MREYVCVCEGHLVNERDIGMRVEAGATGMR